MDKHTDSYDDRAKGSRKTFEFDAINLVADTLRALPDAEQKEQCDHFQKLLEAAPEYQRSVDWYFFRNMASYLKDTRAGHTGRETHLLAEFHKATPPLTQTPPRQTAEQKEETKKIVEKAVETAKFQLSLLYLTMPNGKAMRYCTGTEMRLFGAGFAKIARKVGRKLVGEVLNDDQVRALMPKK